VMDPAVRTHVRLGMRLRRYVLGHSLTPRSNQTSQTEAARQRSIRLAQILMTSTSGMKS
jgi:hypothetical protein